jgi:hypothetical protein
MFKQGQSEHTGLLSLLDTNLKQQLKTLNLTRVLVLILLLAQVAAIVLLFVK